jgi:hypothetical protein
LRGFFAPLIFSSQTFAIYFFIVLYFFATYITIRDWKTHSSIYKNGIVGIGTLVSCKRVYFAGKLRIIRDYEPIIIFYIGVNKYQYRPMGRFRSPPGKVGEEVKIRFWDKKPERVIMDDNDFNSMYKKSILWEGIGFITIMVYLLFSDKVFPIRQMAMRMFER